MNDTAHECGEHFHWHLNLVNLGDSNLKYLEIRGACKICGRKASFRGPAGINPSHPTVSIGGEEAVFPFVLEGETFDGKAAGFSVSAGGAN